MREDWIEIELGEVLKLKNGFAFKSSKYRLEGIPIIRISDINQGIVTADKAKRITENEEYNDYQVEFGDILIAMSGATTGKFGIYKSNQKTYQNQRVGKLKLHNDKLLDKNYIYYLLYSLRQTIEKVAYGGAQPNISGKKVEALEFKLAPLPEQRAIVAKIEQLFSELDNGIANLKAAKDKLEIYRQAVLKKAFEGEWETCTVGNKFKFLGGGTPKKSIPEYWNGDIPWCSVKDVKGDFLYKTKDYITELGLKESSTNIAEIGEVILITRISPGKSIITKIRTAINQDLKIVSPIDDYSPKFTHYLFKSIKREMLKKSNGTTVLGINLNNLKDISIPDIPEEDQNHVIEFIESRLSICENVLANIEEGLNKSEALRQSILKQAFEGKLLSEEEVEACRAAPDWEPAEQLLERIKNQKEGTA